LTLETYTNAICKVAVAGKKVVIKINQI